MYISPVKAFSMRDDLLNFCFHGPNWFINGSVNEFYRLITFLFQPLRTVQIWFPSMMSKWVASGLAGS